MITLFSCHTDEHAAVCQDFEQADQECREDSAERMAGDCERCQEPHEAGLTMVGGQAICDPCLEVEVAP